MRIDSGQMKRIVAIGGSAGSIEPLRQVVQGLNGSRSYAVLIVIPTMADAPSMLPKILEKASGWPASHPVDGEVIREGRIYVAPPDHHMTASGEILRIGRGPKENSHRPSIDVLFRSVARSMGPEVTGVLLSGMGADGSAGLHAIQTAGGRTIVQDPEEALFPTMLRKAAALLKPDGVLPAAKIGAAVAELAMVTGLDLRNMQPTEPPRADEDIEASGRMPSPYSCPECGGVLWEKHEGQLFGYKCRVGHTYSYDALINEQTQLIERALWAGLRALEEKKSLLERLANESHEGNRERSAERFESAARELEEPAQTFRALLMHADLYQQPQREDGSTP